ncbi:cobalamin biosynthesis protein [Devosia faecipullorum]|uniref:cobalamin biosynthesis protein n=1 Tax=Devosia faecipullorum TaxID=2755039 RepID=UPI002ED9DF31
MGLGARFCAGPEEILHLLDATLAEAGLDRHDLAALATLDGKQSHPALRSVADRLALPLLAVPPQDLPRDVPNPSPHVTHYLALPSVAEASALAFGPLLVEKRRSANATCALSRWTPPYALPTSSAASAASTLSTSSAGP